MALIKCNECGQKISDKAISCPKCGCSIKKKEKLICSECGNKLENNKCNNCGYEEKNTKSKNEISDVNNTNVIVKDTNNSTHKKNNNSSVGGVITLICMVITGIMLFNLFFGDRNKSYAEESATDWLIEKAGYMATTNDLKCNYYEKYNGAYLVRCDLKHEKMKKVFITSSINTAFCAYFDSGKIACKEDLQKIKNLVENIR